MENTIKIGGINANLAPDAFHRWAYHYLKCSKDFQSPHRFSPVPYFLVCRAIELEIKARHLKRVTQIDVKKDYHHDLIKAYKALNENEKNLNNNEEYTLQVASHIYKDKGFEYFDAQDALTGYSRFPELTILYSIANKLIILK